MELTFKQIYALIKADLKVGQTPALMGEPGIGKSSLIEDLAREFKTKVFTLPCNQLADRADLTGVRMVERNGSWRQEAFPHSVIMDAIEYAEKHPDQSPILFLDEFNRASADITSAVLSFQTLRRVGTIDFPPNLRLIVAGNDKGNVTALDGASLSRFSVYKVKPDLETFFSVQTLNPFIADVLTKYPDDLMAKEASRVMDTDDDASQNQNGNGEEEDEMDFASLEFLSEENFMQITRPRTITYCGKWLDAMNIKKTNTEEEKEILTSLFTDLGDDGNTLLAGIIAHVGQTSFAYHLFDAIQAHFNSMLTASFASAAPILTAIRPKQDIINTLAHAKGVAEVEELLDTTSEAELVNTMVWLTENASVKEVNNLLSCTSFMSSAPYKITQLDGTAIKNLMKVLPDSSRMNAQTVAAMLGSGAPVIDQWKPMLESVLE